MNEYLAGSTSVIEVVDILDSTSTTGAGKTGLVYNSAGLTCYYKRSNGTASVAVSLVTITTLGTFASGGFKEIDGTNQPGSYEFHPPNAALASGAKWVTFYFVGATGMVRTKMKYRLLAADPDDVVSERNSMADAILVRNASNVESTAGEHTLCTVILAMLENTISGTTLTIKRTNGSTTHATKTLTTNSLALPITGVQ